MPILSDKEKDELFHKLAAEKKTRCDSAQKHMEKLMAKHAKVLDALETVPGEFAGAHGYTLALALEAGVKIAAPGKSKGENEK